jgi:hypothetical protein
VTLNGINKENYTTTTKATTTWHEQPNYSKKMKTNKRNAMSR